MDEESVVRNSVKKSDQKTTLKLVAGGVNCESISRTPSLLFVVVFGTEIILHYSLHHTAESEDLVMEQNKLTSTFIILQ